jgi:hypothetical protein
MASKDKSYQQYELVDENRNMEQTTFIEVHSAEKGDQGISTYNSTISDNPELLNRHPQQQQQPQIIGPSTNNTTSAMHSSKTMDAVQIR